MLVRGLLRLVVQGWAARLSLVLAGQAQVGGRFLEWEVAQLAQERAEAGSLQVPVDARWEAPAAPWLAQGLPSAQPPQLLAAAGRGQEKRQEALPAEWSALEPVQVLQRLLLPAAHSAQRLAAQQRGPLRAPQMPLLPLGGVPGLLWRQAGALVQVPAARWGQPWRPLPQARGQVQQAQGLQLPMEVQLAWLLAPLLALD